MTWKDCSSGSITRLIPSAPSAWCWTRWKRCLPACRTKPFCAPELRRLFRWLKDKGVTAVITAEARARTTDTPRAGGILFRLRHPARSSGPRPDCTRHLRVVKYRGALHGHERNFPFSLATKASACCPSLAGVEPQSVERAGFHRHPAARARCWAGAGFFQAAAFCSPAHPHTAEDHRLRLFCSGRRPRASACSFSHSRNRPTRSSRNMRSIGLRLEPWVKRGLSAVSLGAAHALRLGNAPGHHVQGDRRVSTRCRHRGPDYQPDGRGHRLRNQGDGDTAD